MDAKRSLRAGRGPTIPRGFGQLHRSETETRGRVPTSPARNDTEEFQWISRPSPEPPDCHVKTCQRKSNAKKPQTLGLTVSWASAT
jgi:hypothetical protein